MENLGEIAQYIARDNLSAAIAWLDETRAACALLATQPRMGQPIHTKRFGEIRRRVAGNYLVYYRPAPDGVEILVISHGARDQSKLV